MMVAWRCSHTERVLAACACLPATLAPIVLVRSYLLYFVVATPLLLLLLDLGKPIKAALLTERIVTTVVAAFWQSRAIAPPTAYRNEGSKMVRFTDLRTWVRNASLVICAVSAVTAQATVASGNTGRGAAVTPGDRLDQLDRFRDSLSRDDRHRLDKALPRSADGGIARCAKAERSRASCEAAAYMPALRSTGLMRRFLATGNPTTSAK